MYFFPFPLKFPRTGNSMRVLVSQILKSHEPVLGRLLSFVVGGILQTTNLILSLEKLLAVHCILFCVCLHCVAGNQRKAVGHRLSQADLKDEARLCYKSFCQAELSLSSVSLSQSYKCIPLTSGSFQGTWQWFKLAFTFPCTYSVSQNAVAMAGPCLGGYPWLCLTEQLHRKIIMEAKGLLLPLHPKWTSSFPQFSSSLTLTISVDNW